MITNNFTTHPDNLQNDNRIPRMRFRIYKMLENAKVQLVLYGFGIWVLFCFTLAVVTFLDFKEQGKTKLSDLIKEIWFVPYKAFIYTCLMGVPAFINFYLVYRGKIQDLLRTHIINERIMRGWGFPMFLAFTCVLSCLFAALFERLKNVEPIKSLETGFLFNFWAIELISLIAVSATYTRETIKNNRKMRRLERLEESRKLRYTREELTFIKHQIRPHFLFNTLYGLEILAKQKDEQLPDLINKLAFLLRYLMEETNTQFVPIEKELRFLNSYVELERLLLNEDTDLKYEARLAPSVSGKIAPMILLIFVENCFKHYNKGSESTKFIHISAHATMVNLTLTAKNSFEVNAKNEHETRKGIGLDLVRKTLKLIYKETFTLNETFENGCYTTQLILPITH